jgi:hypothetical protein
MATTMGAVQAPRNYPDYTEYTEYTDYPEL